MHCCAAQARPQPQRYRLTCTIEHLFFSVKTVGDGEAGAGVRGAGVRAAVTPGALVKQGNAPAITIFTNQAPSIMMSPPFCTSTAQLSSPGTREEDFLEGRLLFPFPIDLPDFTLRPSMLGVPGKGHVILRGDTFSCWHVDAANDVARLSANPNGAMPPFGFGSITTTAAT